MKSDCLFIIDTYPSTEEQKKILIECINRLSNIGFDIMIVSHLPIPENIQRLATYYIYDSDNTFLPSEKTPFFWVTLFDKIFRVFNSGHSLAITRNMQNALLMSKSAGYDFFYFLEYDVLVDELDIDKLLNLKNEMKNEGKKMIFFEPENFHEFGSHVYETLLFGGEVNYLLSKFLPPKNIEEWDSLGMGHTLELAFYEQLSKYSEDFLIIPEHSSDFLYNSDVNVYRYGLMISDLLYNHNDPNKPILLLYKLFHNQQDYKIKVYHNDSMIHETVMCGGCWWFKDFELDDSILKIEIYLHGELHETKIYILDENINDKIILKGDVKYVV
jgi:hypothetical protein